MRHKVHEAIGGFGVQVRSGFIGQNKALVRARFALRLRLFAVGRQKAHGTSIGKGLEAY